MPGIGRALPSKVRLKQRHSSRRKAQGLTQLDEAPINTHFICKKTIQANTAQLSDNTKALGISDAIKVVGTGVLLR